MKDEETTKRKSGFNPGRNTYMTDDGERLSYTYISVDGTAVTLEVGGEVTVEMLILLDGMDHEADLADRCEKEHRDKLFDAKQKAYAEDPDNEDAADPWDEVPCGSASSETMLFAEGDAEDPMAEKVREVIDGCTDAQQELIWAHFGECRQLEDIRREEAERTGRSVTQQAMNNRKAKILDKAAKALGTERVKRRGGRKGE